MTLATLIVTALTVFFIWAGFIYPLISPQVAGPVRSILFALIVLLIAFLVMKYPTPQIFLPMAVAGLVAVLHRWSGDYVADDAPVATVVRGERRERIPPNGV